MGALLGEGGGNGDGKENGAPGGAIDGAFGAFDGVNALRHSEYSAPEWEAARKAVHAALAPSEREVALRLQSKLSTSGLKGHARCASSCGTKSSLRGRSSSRSSLRRASGAQQLERQARRCVRSSRRARRRRRRSARRARTCGGVSHIVLAKQLQAKAAEMAAAAALLFSGRRRSGSSGKVEELENYMVDYSTRSTPTGARRSSATCRCAIPRNSGAIPAQFRRNSSDAASPSLPSPARTRRPGCRPAQGQADGGRPRRRRPAPPRPSPTASSASARCGCCRASGSR